MAAVEALAQPALAVGDAARLVAVEGEHVADPARDRRLVLDHEDAEARSSRLGLSHGAECRSGAPRAS